MDKIWAILDKFEFEGRDLNVLGLALMLFTPFHLQFAFRFPFNLLTLLYSSSTLAALFCQCYPFSLIPFAIDLIHFKHRASIEHFQTVQAFPYSSLPVDFPCIFSRVDLYSAVKACVLHLAAVNHLLLTSVFSIPTCKTTMKRNICIHQIKIQKPLR